MRDNAWFGNWESVWWKLKAALYWNEFTTLNTDSKQHVYLDALKKNDDTSKLKDYGVCRIEVMEFPQKLLY